MSTESAESSAEQPAAAYVPLKIWPAALLLAAIPTARYLALLFEDASLALMLLAVLGPIVIGVLLMLWWLLASRASRREKVVGGLGLLLLLTLATLLNHKTLGLPGVFNVTVPLGFFVFALMSILCARILSFQRTVVILLATTCGFGYSTLLRNEGMSGEYQLKLHWRWVPSAEDIMLADQQVGELNADETDGMNLTDLDEALANPEWPEFRGPERSGIQRGVMINPDWKTHPPQELWKVPIGPGWSSFVVAGNLLFTQEQRGPQEAVICMDAESGKRLWTYQYETRWEDPLGGPGPRATPTLADGALYSLGPNGHLTRLDPKSGKEIWQKHIGEIANCKPPQWGFSSSPLIFNGLVMVHAGDNRENGTVLAFDCETGELKWSVPSGTHTYSSAHLADIAGAPAVLMVTNQGLDILDPLTGEARLNYEWTTEQYRALQPTILGDDILIPTGMGYGMVRIQVTSGEGKLTAKELWTSLQMKGDFNDAVAYQDHAFGFDGSIFACISLETGKRTWKRGRYGSGQVLLLEDTGHLLVISEAGELVLLKADPAKHTELAKVSALDGKTWNHPVLIGDRLYIRNSQEAACYQLELEALPTESETPLAAKTE